MMSTTGCPDENTLLRVSLGERDEVELASLEAHLDGCADCRRVLAAAASEETIPAAVGYPAFATGEVLGRYTVEGLLGVGGMGIVYAVRDAALGRPVALKVLRTGSDPESNARLAREAQTMARLSHPNLVSVFELGDWQGRLFLAMELVDGVSLEAWRKAAPRRPAEVLEALLEAGKGLAAAHAAGVVHRDFKPGNVLIGRDGRVRVTDFGLARARHGDGVASVEMLETQSGALLGTPAYMSPEQLAGQRVDARSDQFSFCVTLAEALSGARPFVGRNRESLELAMQAPPALSGVPRRFRAALTRGLSVDPARRFASLEALFSALHAAQRRPRLVALAVLAMALLLATGLGIQRAVAVQEVEQAEVLVAKVDIAEGSTLTFEMLASQKMPAAYVTTSVVRPDSANYILGQVTLVPIQARDLLQWQQFESRRVVKP